MPSAKDGIGVPSGQKISSIPPPVPTCPPPFDAELGDNGLQVLSNTHITFNNIHISLNTLRIIYQHFTLKNTKLALTFRTMKMELNCSYQARYQVPTKTFLPTPP